MYMYMRIFNHYVSKQKQNNKKRKLDTINLFLRAYIHQHKFICVQQYLKPEQLEYHILKNYEYLAKVGKGTYGVVYKAKHKKTQRIVAIKKIIDAFQNLIDAKRTYRELNYLLQLNHPCIIKLQTILNLSRKANIKQTSTTRLAIPPFMQQKYGSNTDKLFNKAYSQQRHVYAVFQFVETDLCIALQKYPRFQTIQRKYIAYQLLHGIAYMHRSGLVHRDIKPSNILLDCSCLSIKICDFGMARMKITTQSNNEGVLTQYVASRWYRPPEALLGILTCQDSIDLWSLGCVLAELLLKQPLFRGKSTLDQLQLIFGSIGMPSLQQIDRITSQQAQYVLRNFTFSKKSKFRSIRQLLNQGCSQQIDLIMSLLKFEPSQRITAELALQHEYFDQIKSMENNLQKYNDYSTKLVDLSMMNRCPQSQQRNNSNSGIDHYRYLVYELQKYAERSSNKTDCGHQTNQSSNIAITRQFSDCQNHKHGNFVEKSTKQSDFVSLNKHHYLHQPATTPQELQTEQPVISKIQHTITNQNLPITKIAQSSKQISKQIRPTLNNQKLTQNIQKIHQKPTSSNKNSKNSRDKRTTKVQIQSRQQLHSPKNICGPFHKKSKPFLPTNARLKDFLKNKTEQSEHLKKKPISRARVSNSKNSRGVINFSTTSNPSNVSLKRQSMSSSQKFKQKQQKSQQLIKMREQNIKKLIKYSKASSKNRLSKCTSAKLVDPFKRKT